MEGNRIFAIVVDLVFIFILDIFVDKVLTILKEIFHSDCSVNPFVGEGSNNNKKTKN